MFERYVLFTKVDKRALLGTNNVLIENIVYNLDYIYIC